MIGPIKYRKGYKYQLAQDVSGQTPIKPEREIDTEFIKLSVDGFLFIKCGYAWDGATLVRDTKSAMTASLVHDCFYQLIRQGYLPDAAKLEADLLFYDLLRSHGMWIVRAKLWLAGLRIVSSHDQKPKEVYTAP